MHPPMREAMGVVCFFETAGPMKPSACILGTRVMRWWLARHHGAPGKSAAAGLELAARSHDVCNTHQFLCGRTCACRVAPQRSTMSMRRHLQEDQDVCNTCPPVTRQDLSLAQLLQAGSDNASIEAAALQLCELCPPVPWLIAKRCSRGCRRLSLRASVTYIQRT